MDVFAQVSLVAATITAGLIAGLFYSYACSVMPALAHADDQTFVTSMREIDKAILNGWFALSFAGAPVLALVAGVAQVPRAAHPALPWVVAGFVLLVVMLGITMVVHLPLNAGLHSTTQTASVIRRQFEERWVRWNVLRTLAATAGFGCLTWALVVHNRH